MSDILRCPGGLPLPDGSTCPADEPYQHFAHDLREQVAEAIRRYPNADAEWWIGPEAAIGVVEDYLAADRRP